MIITKGKVSKVIKDLQGKVLEEITEKRQLLKTVNRKPALTVVRDPNFNNPSFDSYLKQISNLCSKFGIELNITDLVKPRSDLGMYYSIKLNARYMENPVLISCPFNKEEVTITSYVKDRDCLNGYGTFSNIDPVYLDLPLNDITKRRMPITAEVLYDILDALATDILLEDMSTIDVVLVGNGMTTNRILNHYLIEQKDPRFSIKILNRHTAHNLYINYNTIVISATGKAESVFNEIYNSNPNYNKLYFISPTVAHNSKGEWSHDLSKHLDDSETTIDTHDVFGNIGTLTGYYLIRRVLDRYEADINGK